MIDATSVVLGLITLAGGCGWLVDRRKHRQEVESLRADNRQKDMNLSRNGEPSSRNPCSAKSGNCARK